MLYNICSKIGYIRLFTKKSSNFSELDLKRLKFDNFFDYTDDGRLLGHIVIADKIITDSIAGIDDFPSEKAKLIRHLVLSHQGEYEQATPVLPQTLEANILYINDLMDSRVGGIKKVLAKTRQPGQRWSNYVKLIERYIYFGPTLH